jgi:hypothetical protein
LGENERRVSVAWTLGRLSKGESWELRGFQTPEDRAAYEALVSEVAAERSVPITLRGDGTSLVVIRN